MRNFCKRTLFLLIIFSLVIGLAGCGGGLPEMMDSGASNFGSGKPEEDYSLKNSGTLLESLIDDYSGSYQLPSGSTMDQSAYEDAYKKAGGEGESGSGATSEEGTAQQPTFTMVGSREDLMRLFHQAFLETADSVEFELVNGYSPDLSKEVEYCYWQLQREDPIYVGSLESYSCGNRGAEYIVRFNYTMPKDELIRIKDATADLVNQAAASIDVTGLSTYEIVCAVNEYLCDTVYYPPNEPYAAMTHTAYGALHDGVAVCEGYACAAKLLLNKLGVQCDIQIGTCTDGGGHAWNLVLVDGQWYQLDVTWNDGSTRRTDYLLVSDDYMLKSRTWEFSDYPACPAEYAA